MKQRYFSLLIAGVLGAYALTGCQKAPEASADNDVYRAKSSLEREVENIAAKEAAVNTAGTDGAKPGGSYDALVGTEQNGIWICAKIPAVPQAVPVLVLRERDDLDTEKLRELLDSESGKVRDITAEYVAQREKELREMAEEDKPGECLDFGDDSLLILSDGSKEASFARNTCASYVDKTLKKDCDAIYKKAPEVDAIRDSTAASAKFSISRAEEILQKKLEVLDISEIAVSEAFYYELDGTAFYELSFTPSYKKLGVASEFGSIRLGEVFSRGTAWITENGAADLSLVNFCGKITEQSDRGNILTFSQVAGILEKYLESDTLCGIAKAKLTQVELVYYPALRESELILTPAWHIYVPLKDMMDSLESGDKVWQKVAEKGAAWNIYLDAVTGELMKVE
ncbi:MAG: hypothetical protein K2N87_09750 [Eubacterium sp.]|nr:hypothetical protein [Eubacterium sp.]